MGIIVGPHEVVDQVVLSSECEPGSVVLERSETLAPEVLAGQEFKFRAHEHVVLEIPLVHSVERPRHPPNTSLDRAKLQRRVGLGDPRGTQVGKRFHRL